MKKSLIASLLTAVMVITLTACAAAPAADTAAPAAEPAATEEAAPADEAPAAEPAAEASGEGLVIAIWDNNQEPGLTQILEDFTAKTGIKATIQVTPWDQYWTMLEAGATSGEFPADVFWMHSNTFTSYAESDMLLDITDKIAASSDIDLANYPADIVGLYNYEGKQFAVPKDYDTIALWYNKQMFDEAGIAYPDDTWTWDDLADAAKKLTKDDGSQYGYACATSNNQDGWYNIAYSMGGEIINDAKNKSGMDEEATIKAVKFVSDLVKGGYTPSYDVMAENNPEALLTADTIAMCSSGSWMLRSVTEADGAKDKYDLAVLPKDATTGKRVTIYNGLGWAAAGVMNDNGKIVPIPEEKAEQCWKLIEYLGSKEAQQKQSDLGIVISAYVGTEKNWTNANPDFNLQAYLDMANAEMVFRPYSKNTPVWEGYITEDLVPVWTGEADAEEVCKSIAEKMNAALAEE